LGFAADNFLFYGTGGLAYGKIQADGRISDNLGDSWKGTASTTDWGWTLGAGAEYAFDQDWIVGAEYLYVDLGSTDFNINSNHVNEKANGNVNAAFSVVRATVKYKF
jgi:outer membrane immunogenic protein